MFAVNALANYLPINGLNTGEVSALYPNLFVPDGMTFGIWSIIYLWLLVFVGYATNILVWLPGVDHRYDRIVALLPLFWLTCLLNASWIIAWHYLQVVLSLIIMLLLLVCLFQLFRRIQAMRAHPRKRDHLLVEVPFIIYFGWITVATIANTTALLVHYGYTGSPLNPEIWAVLLVVIAALIGIYVTITQHRPSFALVIIWALWGVQRAQPEAKSTIGLTALLCIGALLAFAISELLQPQKGWKKSF